MIHELLSVLGDKSVRSNLRMASCFALVLSLLALVPSLAVSVVLDRVIKFELRQELIGVLALLLLFHALEVILDYLVAKISDLETERLASALENVFLRCMQLADYRRIEGFSRSELQAKFAGLAGIAGSFVEWRVWMIVAPISSILIFLALGYCSKILSAIIFLLTAIYLIVHSIFKIKIKDSTRNANKSREVRYRKLFELFENLPNARAMNLLAYFMETLKEASSRLREKIQESNHLLMWQSAFGDAYQRLVLAVILGVGAYQVIDGKLSVGQLVMANMLSRHLASNVKKISALSQKRRNFLVEMEGVKEMSGMLGDAVPVRRLYLFDSIAVENLEFRYPGKSKSAFRGLSFFASWGQLIVVTGPSGCGKSTLLKVLAGLYMPSAGTITLEAEEGIPKKKLNVGYMLQREMIFDGSIEENISMGRSNISPADLKWACEISGASEFIENFPEKMKFKINENGVNISGGQRQRLGLARTLAGRPDLILLDEPTAALDGKSKKMIAEALRKISGLCTSVVVTHDPEIVDLADIVVEFDHYDSHRVFEKRTRKLLVEGN